MQNLPVAVRIIGGYVIVVVLAAAISITGILGITSMSSSFDEISQKAMPMLDDSSLLVTHTLLAQRRLTEFGETRDLETLNEIENQFKELVGNNEKIAAELRSLIQDAPELLKMFNEAEAAQDQLVQSGETLMMLHRESLQKAQVVSQQAGQFGDMGDETLSFAYDMEGEANTDSLLELLSDLETDIENMTESVNDAVRSGMKVAVLQARSELTDAYESIESKINTLANTDEFRGNEAIPGMRAAYNQQKTTANALLSAYTEQLDAEAAANASFLESANSTNQTVDLLGNLVDGVHQSVEEVKVNTKSVIENSRTSLITFAVIALIVSITVALLITSSIKKPLSEIVSLIKTIATGDLTHDFNNNRKDEIGQLADSMQNLVEQLRNMLSEVNSSSEQLATTAEESSTISNLTFDNVSRQKEQTDQMVTAVHEMTAAVNDVSTSASLTLTEVEGAHGDVNSGEQVLTRNIARFEGLAEDIKNAADVIQKLNDDCKNIGGVLDVIKGVAEQTNLLALNAAIEAARAGEQGRGFAVVADEVRTLASRAHDSTAEIEDMIARLQSRASDAVSVMEKSQEEASRSVESISEAGNALRQVATAISTIKDMSTQIASAAEEQTAASQTQMESITAIAEVAEDTANGAQESQTASKELAKMAEIQRGLVGKFKL